MKNNLQTLTRLVNSAENKKRERELLIEETLKKSLEKLQLDLTEQLQNELNIIKTIMREQKSEIEIHSKVIKKLIERVKELEKEEDTKKNNFLKKMIGD